MRYLPKDFPIAHNHCFSKYNFRNMQKYFALFENLVKWNKLIINLTENCILLTSPCQGTCVIFYLGLFIIIQTRWFIHLNILYSIKVFNCGNPTSNLSILNIQYKSGSGPATTIYRTSAILACSVGYYWIDAAVIKNISCQANGIWSPIPPCIG